MDRTEFHPKYLNKVKHAGTTNELEENVYATEMEPAGPKASDDRVAGPSWQGSGDPRHAVTGTANEVEENVYATVMKTAGPKASDHRVAGPSWQGSGDPRRAVTDSEEPPVSENVIYDRLYMHAISADAVSQATTESSIKKESTWKIPLAVTGLAFLVTIIVVLILTVPSKQPGVSNSIKALQFDITLKDKVFNASLTDPTTIQYKILKVEVEGKLKIILMKTVAGFRSVSVIGFSEGSVVSRVNITSNDTKITPESIATAFKDSNSSEKDFFAAAGLVAVTEKSTTSMPWSTGLADISPTGEGTAYHADATEVGKGRTGGQATTVPTASTMHDITTDGKNEGENGSVDDQATTAVGTTLMQDISTNRGNDAQCTVEYDKTCYWFVIHSSKDIDYRNAKQICYAGNGKLALVPDATLYLFLLEHIRELTPHEPWAHAWTGIIFDAMNGIYMVRNGTTSYTSWAPGYPVYLSDHTHVLLRVWGDTGMINMDHSFRTHIAICET